MIMPAEIIEGIRMLSIEDIAAMKINAVAFDGERPKDFIDIYAILENRSLNELTDVYARKYTDRVAQEDAIKISNLTGIRFDKQVNLKDKNISWDHVAARLKEAVLKPDKIFDSDDKKLIQKHSRNPRQGRGLH